MSLDHEREQIISGRDEFLLKSDILIERGLGR
jgi:hypothetical protein